VDFRKQRALRLVVAVVLLSVFSLLALVGPNDLLRNASAVDAVGVGVYWDSACTRVVTSIDWGVLSPGASKKISVYLKNQDSSAIRFLFVRTENWNPSAASDSLKLSLDCSAATIYSNQTVSAHFALNVSDKIVGITTFAFNIVVCASPYLAGDVDHDGKVGPIDVALFGRAYGSTPGQPEWNPNADFDWSGRVGAFDFALLSTNYGKRI